MSSASATTALGAHSISAMSQDPDMEFQTDGII